ncbi:hypothetical protein B0T16DRAFT_414797, partial [Cercophora newfieldiana]
MLATVRRDVLSENWVSSNMTIVFLATKLWWTSCQGLLTGQDQEHCTFSLPLCDGDDNTREDYYYVHPCFLTMLTSMILPTNWTPSCTSGWLLTFGSGTPLSDKVFASTLRICSSSPLILIPLPKPPNHAGPYAQDHQRKSPQQTRQQNGNRRPPAPVRVHPPHQHHNSPSNPRSSPVHPPSQPIRPPQDHDNNHNHDHDHDHNHRRRPLDPDPHPPSHLRLPPAPRLPARPPPRRRHHGLLHLRHRLHGHHQARRRDRQPRSAILDRESKRGVPQVLFLLSELRGSELCVGYVHEDQGVDGEGGDNERRGGVRGSEDVELEGGGSVSGGLSGRVGGGDEGGGAGGDEEEAAALVVAGDTGGGGGGDGGMVVWRVWKGVTGCC